MEKKEIGLTINECVGDILNCAGSLKHLYTDAQQSMTEQEKAFRVGGDSC